MRARIITANRLTDGAVVYLAGDRAWSRAIDAARLAETAEDEAALTALAEIAVAERQVVAPYAIEVEAATGRIAPVRLKESIRAKGPTVPSQA